MSDVIYVPAGRAFEYSPLALNIYRGCVGGCTYCFGPATMRMKAEEFHKEAVPRKDILSRLEKDCQAMRGDKREVLISFTGDPYPPVGNELTRTALRILEEYEMTVTVLTKNGPLAIRDFDILARNGWSFGTSIVWADDALRAQYEPNTATVAQRIGAMVLAKQKGIRTWVSVEPVINPDEALAAISMTRACVDHYKVGKLNARSKEHKKLEAAVDWVRFLRDVEKLLAGHSHYIKQSLEAYR